MLQPVFLLPLKEKLEVTKACGRISLRKERNRLRRSCLRPQDQIDEERDALPAVIKAQIVVVVQEELFDWVTFEMDEKNATFSGLVMGFTISSCAPQSIQVLYTKK